MTHSKRPNNTSLYLLDKKIRIRYVTFLLIPNKFLLLPHSYTGMIEMNSYNHINLLCPFAEQPV